MKREEQGVRSQTEAKREEQRADLQLEGKREDEIQDTIQHMDISQLRQIEAVARQRREQLEREDEVTGRIDRIPEYFKKYQDRCQFSRCPQGVEYFQGCLEAFLALSSEEKRQQMGQRYTQFLYDQEADWEHWAQQAKEEYEAHPTPRARMAGNKRERFPWEMKNEMLWGEESHSDCEV